MMLNRRAARASSNVDVDCGPRSRWVGVVIGRSVGWGAPTERYRDGPVTVIDGDRVTVSVDDRYGECTRSISIYFSVTYALTLP